MCFKWYAATAVYLCLASATYDVQRAGWLDRVVQYHKNSFFNDVKTLPPVKITARIEAAPPGYTDSDKWDLESVMRLLTLLRESEGSRHVHLALRRALRPTRRIMMSRHDSFKFFPSIHKDNYYDSDYSISEEDISTTSGPITDDSIVIVSNPVEARLPSAQISVRMLRRILEMRAIAAREMPSTTKATIDWAPMNRTTRSNRTVDAGNATTPAATDGESTASSGGSSNVTEKDGGGGGGGEGGEQKPEEETGRREFPEVAAQARKKGIEMKNAGRAKKLRDAKQLYMQKQTRKAKQVMHKEEAKHRGWDWL